MMHIAEHGARAHAISVTDHQTTRYQKYWHADREDKARGHTAYWGRIDAMFTRPTAQCGVCSAWKHPCERCADQPALMEAAEMDARNQRIWRAETVTPIRLGDILDPEEKRRILALAKTRWRAISGEPGDRRTADAGDDRWQAAS